MRLYCEVILFLFFISTFSVAAQVPDTIQQKLQGLELHQRIDELNTYSRQFIRLDAKKAKTLADEALALSQKNGYRIGEARALNNIAYFYLVTGQFEKSLQTLSDAAKLAKRHTLTTEQAEAQKIMGALLYRQGRYSDAEEAMEIALQLYVEMKDSTEIAKMHHNLGAVYYSQNKPDKALKNYLEALELDDALHNDEGRSSTLSNIGTVYEDLKQFDEAFSYYYRALKMQQLKGDKSGTAVAFMNIANVYYKQGNYKPAIENNMQALKLFKQQDDKQHISYVLNNLGNCHKDLQQYQKAQEYFEASLEIKEGLGNSPDIAATLGNLGEVYYHLGLKERGIKTIERSIELAKESKSFDWENSGYQRLSEIYFAEGDLAKALEYQKLFAATKDSILSVEITRQIAEMRAKYENEKMERDLQIAGQQAEIDKLQINEQNLLIREKNMQLAVAGGGFVLILIIGGLGYSRYKHKQRQRQHEELLKRQELRTQAIIETQEQERSRIAKDLHDGIGQLLSAARMNYSSLADEIANLLPDRLNDYQNSTRILDDACNELRSIAQQMMPRSLQESTLAVALEDLVQKTLGKSPMRHTFNCFGFEDNELTEQQKIGVFRIVQELIGNSIKHSGATEITIQLYKIQNTLVLMVEDNGNGIPLKRKSSGMGLFNINSRAQSLGGNFGIEAVPQGGTLAILRLPLNRTEVAVSH